MGAVVRMLHPATALLRWGGLIILTQSLGGWVLAIAVSALAGGAVWFGGASFWRLLRRIRYLLLAIAILFAWMTPGEALIPFWVEFGPTREGFRLALDHGMRLVGVVSLVAMLLGAGGRDFLISGFYALSGPAGWLGLSRERLAIRLLLVLRFAEERPAGSWRDWLTAGAADGDLRLHVVRHPFSWIDGCVVAGCCGLVLAWGWL